MWIPSPAPPIRERSPERPPGGGVCPLLSDRVSSHHDDLPTGQDDNPPHGSLFLTESLPPPLPFDTQGLDRAQAGVRDSSFYRSFSLLGPESREDLYDFYVFCRLVDDLADEPRTDIDVRAHLDAWAWSFAHDFAAPPGWEEAPFFLRTVGIAKKRKIPSSLYGEIVRGMQDDLTRVRIPDTAALLRYCYRAAGAVGRICVPIFGGDLDRLGPYADLLGEAFQLTNILRDLAQDASRDRIYLPADRMRHFGVTDDDVLAGHLHDGMRSLLTEIWSRSEEDYERARELLSDPADQRTMIAARAMETVYHAIHKKIRKTGFDVYRRRVGLGPLEKATVLLRLWRARKAAGL